MILHAALYGLATWTALAVALTAGWAAWTRHVKRGPRPPRLEVCACACPPAAHEHLRPGSDCGRCGPAACPRYRPQPYRPARAAARAVPTTTTTEKR